MSIIMIEGFDHLTAAQFSNKKGWENSATFYIDSAWGRFGGQGARVITTTGHIIYISESDYSTLYFGIAAKVVDADPIEIGLSSSYPLFGFFGNTVTQHLYFIADKFGRLRVYRSSDNVIIGTTSKVCFEYPIWHYLEIKITISDTVGVVEIRRDGETVLNLTNQDTQNGAVSSINKVHMGCIYSSVQIAYDDMYLDDAEFHGDVRVRTFLPDADGNSVDFTRSAEANDFECVDELISNEDTDYISSATLNHKSLFGITTGALGTVKAIQVNNHVREDDVGTQQIKPIIRSNSTDYQGTETDVIGATYTFENEIFETDPDDAAVWTQTKLEAAEFGLEITT